MVRETSRYTLLLAIVPVIVIMNVVAQTCLLRARLRMRAELSIRVLTLGMKGGIVLLRPGLRECLRQLIVLTVFFRCS